MNANQLWDRYKKHLCRIDSAGLTLDISRMTFGDGYFSAMEPAIQKAFTAMDALEKGAIANPDEDRMVGHYWLRAADLAPKPEMAKEIKDTLKSIKTFAADVHSGKIKPPTAPQFTHVLSIGIGGSALGPEFVADPLADKMYVHFIDNDRSRRDRACAGKSGRRTGRDADHRLHQERWHSGNSQWHDDRRRGVQSRRVGIQPARRGHHHARIEDGQGGG